jgi:hypothetical protein
MQLDITTSLPCINNCKFCPQDLLRKKYSGEKRLSLENFIEILKKVPKNIYICFAGFSETFANKQSSAMMRHTADQGYYIALYTTLVGCTDADIDIIAGINFYPCVIHVPDNTNLIVKNEDKWIETYKKFSSRVHITENIFHIGQVSDKIKEATGWANYSAPISRANSVDENIACESYKKGKIKCNNNEAGELLPNGDVVLCCMDYGLKHKLGNLLTDSYEDLYESEEFKKVRLGMDDESIDLICRYCHVSSVRE